MPSRFATRSFAAVALATWGAFVPLAHAQTFGGNVTGGDNSSVSSLIGADVFYNAGYTGSRAIVANIEGGLFYHYHTALAQDTIQLAYGGTYPAALGPDPNDPNAPNAVHDPNLTNDPLWSQYDEHATSVAGVIGAAPLYAGDPRAGIAYGATLVSGSIATDWVGAPYSLSFDITDTSFITPYVNALTTGISGANGRLANVVNGSYGYTDGGTSGADPYTVALDGLARSNGATVVWSSGNNGYGAGNVNDPGAGYNGITVGGLAYQNSSAPYTTIASFSSGGPSDFQKPDGTIIRGVRATVDIVAPADDINTLLYSGATGGNTGGTLPPDTLPASWYTSYGGFSAGTSFSAPIVSGAATLLVDVGYDRYNGGDSIEGNVIKAVLLNSADKIPGWNNGQTTVSGVVMTTQALDYASGAGALNLGKAFTQYTQGVNDVSHGATLSAPAIVAATGWDYGLLVPNATQANPFNDYYIATSLVAGTTFNATLTWFVDRSYDGLVDDSTGTPTITSSDLRFTNLDLEVWQVVNGVPFQLVALSDASYISTQELSFVLPTSGQYMLRILWAGDQYNVDNSDSEGQAYGLAWSSSAAAPDASTLLLVLFGSATAGTIFLIRRKSVASRFMGTL